MSWISEGTGKELGRPAPRHRWFAYSRVEEVLLVVSFTTSNALPQVFLPPQPPFLTGSHLTALLPATEENSHI
jgi:hypothetical protein